MTLSADILLAEYEDIIATTAQEVVASCQQQLPDLSSVCIFIPPSGGLSTNFRKALLCALPQQYTAVIPPYVGTLRQWIGEHIALPDPDLNLIADQARQLLLVEALAEHPGIFKEENKWPVSTALLALFDELALNEIDVLEQSAEEWQTTLERAYGAEQLTRHLQQEARLVQTLWHAWQQQLHANKLLDSTSAYVARLRQAPSRLSQDWQFFVIDPDQYTACEQHTLARIANNNGLTVLAYDRAPDTAQAGAAASTAAFINAAFDHKSATLKQRAAAYRRSGLSASLPWSIFYAGDAETEARAIDLQIRLWLLQGKQDIAIVSEDRKLSRRLRALLERANIDLQDLAGWSLTTTSAAAVLERWLECIEEDFDYRPMLDLLKSHFYDAALDREQQLEAIYRLENDIILHENISHGIERYRKHLQYRSHRLRYWPQRTYDDIVKLLDQLEDAALYLQRLYRSKRKTALADYLEHLTTSLQHLGILGTFANDAAGVQILNVLDQMQRGLQHCNPKMHWQDFRTWLSVALEQEFFSPHKAPSPVRLMSLAQAQCQRFEALVIAAADKQHLPGKPVGSPFFNQSVRRSLGLPDWQQQLELDLIRFKRLLQSAGETLITCKHEENGEPVPLSPWIEALQTFYALSCDASLKNDQLQPLLEQHTGVFICDTDALPSIPTQPRPSLPAAALPQRLSASAHQRLIDCPYKYFAADGMRLKPPDEITEELQKSDYGERVHKILNAFHMPVKHLPAPFTERVTSENCNGAIDHLTTVSRIVFKQDLENNVLHRSWLHRWLQRVPAYIDWQIQQQQHWQVSETEKHCETALAETGLTLYGRLDRVDTETNQGRHRTIIDYKTGSTASQADVDSGEDVQLVTYAMLASDVSQVLYLSLDQSDGSVRTKTSLADEALQTLTRSSRERLQSIIAMQRDGQPMPAWGDEQTCSYCDFIGLCRKRIWGNAG
mgnify:CR=1 FL=1